MPSTGKRYWYQNIADYYNSFKSQQNSILMLKRLWRHEYIAVLGHFYAEVIT